MILYLLGSLVTAALLLGAFLYLGDMFFKHLKEDEGAAEAFDVFLKRLLFPPKEKKEEPKVEAATAEKEVF